MIIFAVFCFAILCIAGAVIHMLATQKFQPLSVVLGVLMAGFSIGGGLYGQPVYAVWQQDLEGQAELARANQNKQIRIAEAQSKKEAAQHEADAEIIRARGVAEANKIIADGLGGPEGYLRWRYIEMLQETGGQGRETIYIPTEAGMPILEANRRPAQ